VRRNRLWKVVRVAVTMDPFFTCKSHPLNMKFFNLFSAHDTRNRNSHDTVFSGSPDNQVSVLSMEPSRKLVCAKPFFRTFVKQVPNESSFGATVTVVVRKFRLVRLLTACYRFCTCNKKLWSFLVIKRFYFLCAFTTWDLRISGQAAKAPLRRRNQQLAAFF
jgi:hypothetical protein